ncbi:DNA-binding XRE family transcriptional regulator [Lachnospiraceae bacterium PM6-15]|uniref:helix-turn-helix transcriptional regulator n=1 Tax=Ohessyouella blattaphilus TaxID=2949333 RepID=UPI003E30671E
MVTKTLATLRKEKDMSQRDLAKELELSPGAIGMYESGKRNPSLAMAKKIAKIFNVSVESISFSNNKK